MLDRPAVKTTMMRRRAMTAGATATLGVAAASVVGSPPAALAVIAGYVLVGGGRAGWLRPRWYEPVMSSALACVSAVLAVNSWWQIGFLAVAVLEVVRAIVLASVDRG